MGSSACKARIQSLNHVPGPGRYVKINPLTVSFLMTVVILLYKIRTHLENSFNLYLFLRERVLSAAVLSFNAVMAQAELS